MFTNSCKTNVSAQKIRTLMTRISNCDAVIDDHKENPNSYYVKAGALVELYQLTGDQKYIKDALLTYSIAVKLNPENALYLIDRAQCRIIIGLNQIDVTQYNLTSEDLVNQNDLTQEGLTQFDLAEIDLKEAAKLPEEDDVGGKHTINQIEKVKKDLAQFQKDLHPTQSSMTL